MDSFESCEREGAGDIILNDTAFNQLDRALSNKDITIRPRGRELVLGEQVRFLLAHRRLQLSAVT